MTLTPNRDSGKPKRGGYSIRVVIDPDGQPITLKGRYAWMMRNLIEVGDKGLTSIERPAPRIAHYVFWCRRLGFAIETIDEKHDGQFPGSHARYRLRSLVRILEDAA
ncbi:winged helix domain-containing protein [Candidatus Phyllobacterium onerii]|uniref:winged helix domain-containing protein n=1 Tax=Candidatus Phyllobacterium onerii TaxID=3020828 RepID=UPI00232F926B|nr:hypothetical protein [Phyllobacterium sp. IY22]